MAGVGGLHPLMLQLPLRAWYRRHASQHVGFDLHLASMAKSSVVAHRCAPTEHDPAASGRARVRS
jgi:hypothetical protein